MDGGAWWATVHGVAEGRARLSDFTFTFHLHALEKEMATHPIVLAWSGLPFPPHLLNDFHFKGNDMPLSEKL